MKTLVLLSAIVLLAFQVQADPIQKTDEETKTEEQSGEETQGLSVYFEGPEASALEDGARGVSLQCTCSLLPCRYPAIRRGICLLRNNIYANFCCK